MFIWIEIRVYILLKFLSLLKSRVVNEKIIHMINYLYKLVISRYINIWLQYNNLCKYIIFKINVFEGYKLRKEVFTRSEDNEFRENWAIKRKTNLFFRRSVCKIIICFFYWGNTKNQIQKNNNNNSFRSSSNIIFETEGKCRRPYRKLRRL